MHTNREPNRASDTPDHRHDVVVVGGRVAGATTAMLLAARGHDVVVLDRAHLPSDTLSTHTIARGGVVQLARLGQLDAVLASGAPPIRRVVFRNGDVEDDRAVRERAGVDHLVAPRRTALDAVLLDAARAAGATVRTGVRVSGLLHDAGRVAGVRATDRGGAATTVRARHVVGADGVRSGVARWAGAATSRCFHHDVSVYYAYVAADWPAMELEVSPGAYAGAFPTHAGQACVWSARPTPLLEPVRRAGADRAAALVATLGATAPGIAARVRQGRVVSGVRGWVSPASVVRVPHGPGWALVGDAGCFKDPVTGHGITDALRDGELLADALHAVLSGHEAEQPALAAYRATRDEAAGPVIDITERMTRFPDPARFAALQVDLARALDAEALRLAARPVPHGLVGSAA